MNFIDGVEVRDLRFLPDERGWLIELLRSDWEVYQKFGQAYATACYPGVIKAWHYHKIQTDHFTCIAGMAKLALYDARENSPTKGMINEFYLGKFNPILVKIPNNVYHGFMAVGNETVTIVNFPTELYNYASPDEYRVAYNDPSIPYSWEIKQG